MNAITYDELVDAIKQLKYEEKVKISKLLNDYFVEEKRKKIVNRVNEARINYETGNVKSGSAEDLMKDLDND